MANRTGSPKLLPLLRSELQARILERLLADPGKSWAVSELAEAFDVSGQAVRNELRRLVDAGILVEASVGRTHVFCASTESPVYEPLRELIERTVGIEPRLREALAGLSGVEAAVIYGSWAAGEARPDSDVDVLVVGTVDYTTLVQRVAEIQDRSGREINLVTIEPDELRRRLRTSSSFIRSILDAPKLPLVGSLSTE